MNLRDFFDVLIRRWWVIVITVLLAAAGAYGYAKTQHRIYQASSTVFAHPADSVLKVQDINSAIGLITYGSLPDTFAALAQSDRLRDESSRDLGVAPDVAKKYVAKVTTLPNTTVIQVSVQGPDPTTAARFADRITARASVAAQRYFPVFALTTLDAAQASSTPIQPKTSQDVLFAALAGLIVGFVIAALSLHVSELMGEPALPMRSPAFPGGTTNNGLYPADADESERATVGARSDGPGAQ